MKLITSALISLFVLLLSCGTTKVGAGSSAAGTETGNIFNRYWKLVEINGAAVEHTNREPHMVLKLEEKRVSGNGGCNSFFGSVEYITAGLIKFSAIGSTKMACPNMDVESKFFQALEQTVSYSVEDNTLLLKKSDGSTVAMFVETRK